MLSEALLTLGWGERPAFAALLADAEDRQVLRRVRSAYKHSDYEDSADEDSADQHRGYEFRDRDLRYYLVRKGEAALAGHQRAIAARLSSPWGRRLSAAWLTRRGIVRASVDTGVGVGIATGIVGAALLRFYGNLGHWGWLLVLPVAVLAGAFGAFTYCSLHAAAGLARLATGCVPGWPRRVRLIGVLAVVAAGWLLVATEGPPAGDGCGEPPTRSRSRR